MKRTHHHTLVLILALAVTLFVAGVYGYMWHVVNASVARAALARDVVRIEVASQAHEEDLRALYENTAADRARLAEFFVPADQAVGFIEAVEAIGPVSGSTIKLSSIGTGARAGDSGDDGESRRHVQATVDAVGSWQAVMKALMLAENMPYASSVQRIRLDASDGKGTWHLTFSIDAAILPETAASSQ